MITSIMMTTMKMEAEKYESSGGQNISNVQFDDDDDKMLSKTVYISQQFI